jgi:hypothetical protein
MDIDALVQNFKGIQKGRGRRNGKKRKITL